MIHKWLVVSGWQMTPGDATHMPSGSQIGSSPGRVFRSPLRAWLYARKEITSAPVGGYVRIHRIVPLDQR